MNDILNILSEITLFQVVIWGCLFIGFTIGLKILVKYLGKYLEAKQDGNS